MSSARVPLGVLIEPASLKRAGRGNFPVLSMTMHGGLVDQASKFKKRIASIDTSQYKVVSRGQLVVGFPIDEGVLAFQDKYSEAIVSPAYGVWNVRDEAQVDRGYLEHFLQSPQALRFYSTKLRGTTARRRSLPADLFLSLPVPLPTVAEQKQVVETLGRAEALRARRRVAVAQLEALPTAIYSEMFGGPNMEGQTATRLGDVTALVTKGTTPTTLGLLMTATGVPFIRVQNLKDGVVDPSVDPQFISEASHRALSRSIVRPGDVLVSIAGTIGRAALVSGSQPEMNCNQAVAIVRPSDRIIDRFLLHWIQGPAAQRQIRGAKVTGTISNISLAQLRSLKLDLPSMEDQLTFARRVAAIEPTRARFAAALAELDALLFSLRRLAFQGTV